MNIEKLWTPSGIRVLSSVVGMTPSTNGRSAPFRNRWASWNASSAYWGEKHSSTEPVWWSWSSLPGSAMKSGSSLMARLIFTTPLRVRQFSMPRTKSAGSSFGARSRRKAICGWIVVTTTGARISSPLSRATPTARPPRTRILATRAPVRISAPKDSAARRQASDTPPIPPSWYPQDPRWPSPTSPIE